MTDVQHYKLIEGQFSVPDASNILFTLFNSKINFHQLESFRIQERNVTNKEYMRHEERVLQLRQALTHLKTVMTEASERNMDLEIHGTIILKSVSKIKP